MSGFVERVKRSALSPVVDPEFPVVDPEFPSRTVRGQDLCNKHGSKWVLTSDILSFKILGLNTEKNYLEPVNRW